MCQIAFLSNSGRIIAPVAVLVVSLIAPMGLAKERNAKTTFWPVTGAVIEIPKGFHEVHHSDHELILSTNPDCDGTPCSDERCSHGDVTIVCEFTEVYQGVPFGAHVDEALALFVKNERAPDDHVCKLHVAGRDAASIDFIYRHEEGTTGNFVLLINPEVPHGLAPVLYAVYDHEADLSQLKVTFPALAEAAFFPASAGLPPGEEREFGVDGSRLVIPPEWLVLSEDDDCTIIGSADLDPDRLRPVPVPRPGHIYVEVHRLREVESRTSGEQLIQEFLSCPRLLRCESIGKHDVTWAVFHQYPGLEEVISLEAYVLNRPNWAIGSMTLLVVCSQDVPADDRDAKIRAIIAGITEAPYGIDHSKAVETGGVTLRLPESWKTRLFWNGEDGEDNLIIKETGYCDYPLVLVPSASPEWRGIAALNSREAKVRMFEEEILGDAMARCYKTNEWWSACGVVTQFDVAAYDEELEEVVYKQFHVLPPDSDGRVSVMNGRWSSRCEFERYISPVMYDVLDQWSASRCEARD